MDEKSGPDDEKGVAENAGAHESPAQMAERLAQISRELQELTQAIAKQKQQPLSNTSEAPKAFSALFEALRSDPEKLAGAQIDLVRRLMGVVQELSESTDAEKLDRDPRFAAAGWKDNPFFDYVRRTYGAFADWMLALPETTPGMSKSDRDVVRFYLRHVADAIAPSNFLMTNPRAMDALIESEGKSLTRGMSQLQSDFDPASGRFTISQTDRDAFTLGENLAATPGQVVFSNTLFELLRYDSTTSKVRERPILIFPPWINKFYVLDLRSDNSMVAWLRDQGFTVYMVSWRNADAETANYSWSDYVETGALAAIDKVASLHKTPINAVGYCIGGALLSSVAARLGQTGDTRIGSLTLLAAQTDFSQPGDLGVLVNPELVDQLETVIASSNGVMPGELMADGFNMLRPRDLIWRYVEDNYLLGITPPPFDLLFWNTDQTNIPGPLHLQYLRELYLANALAEGVFEVQNEKVSLSDIAFPTFVQASERDHISPFTSVYRGARQFGGNVQFVLSESGHIAGVVNPPSANKYGYWTRDGLTEDKAELWLAFAQHHKGSWWPVWADWLHDRSGEWRKPLRRMAKASPAPGEYVQVTLQDLHERNDQSATD